MKKMVKVAAIAAMVLAVALTGCNGKKGEAASQNTEASAESDSTTVSRKQIDAFLKDYEKFVKKAEKMAKKGSSWQADMSSLKEAEELGERYKVLKDSNEWTSNDESMTYNMSIHLGTL